MSWSPQSTHFWFLDWFICKNSLFCFRILVLHDLNTWTFSILVNPENSCARRICECDSKLASDLASQLTTAYNTLHDFKTGVPSIGRNQTCQKLTNNSPVKLQKTDNYQQVGNGDQNFGRFDQEHATKLFLMSFGGKTRLWLLTKNEQICLNLPSLEIHMIETVFMGGKGGNRQIILQSDHFLDETVSECCTFKQYSQFYHPAVQECCSDGVPRSPGTCLW